MSSNMVEFLTMGGGDCEVKIPVKWNIFSLTSEQAMSKLLGIPAFQMQISELRRNNTSYSTALSYFLPSKHWGSEGTWEAVIHHICHPLW